MKDNEARRFLIYTRAATSEQFDDASIREQRERLAQHAARSGMHVAAEYTEVASGVKQARRTELERLMSTIQPGDVVAVSRLDRFSRDARAALHDVCSIVRRGARVISLDEGEFDGSQETNRKLSVLAALAQEG
jgi:DNA invertase Pin-like site-specific DNA recombinase